MTKNGKYYGLALGAALALPLTFQAQNNGVCSLPAGCCAAGTAAATVAVTACEAGKAAACGGEGQVASACAATAGCEVAGASCPVTGGKAEAAVKPGYVRASYQVEGMTCVSCEASLARVLSRIDGVDSPQVSVNTKVAKLTYDPKKVKSSQLVMAIERAGYAVKAETVQVKVDGLACGDCSSQVTAALARVEGVTERKVCHVAKLAAVTFDPKKVSREKVIAAIDQTGFKAVQ